MRLIFGTIFVLAGFLVSMALSRLLTRPSRDLATDVGFKALRLVAWLLVPIGALMILSSGIRMIGAGQVGVALLFGKVQPIALHEGINMVNPLFDVVEMNTRVQKHQARYDAASKDLQAVHVEMVLNYRLKPDQAADVYQRIGPNYGSVIIDPAAQAKGQGDAARERAKGEAEAMKIRADADSIYNQKVSASLTPTLIQQRYLEKWDGKLPQFSAGGNTPGIFLNVPAPPVGRP